jgi:hypothetical protein
MPFDNAGNRYPHCQPNGVDIARRDGRRGCACYARFAFGEIMDPPRYEPTHGFCIRTIARRLHQIHGTPMIDAIEQARGIAYDSNSIFPPNITLHFRRDWGMV